MIPTSYELLPAQQAMAHIEYPEVDLDVCVYQGGFGSGKTFIGAFLGIELCRKYPGIRGLVVAKTFPLLRDTTLQTYFEHFETFGFQEGRDYVWKATEAKLIFPQWGNSEILFRPLQAPYKLKSLNLGWVHVEEMSEITEDAFLMLLSRLRQKGIPRYRLFGTTNPQAHKGWIHRHFVAQNHGLQLEKIGRREVKIHYRRIIAPSTENIYLSPAYLLNMKHQFDPDYYQLNVLGQDGDYTAGLVCKTWADANIEETPYRPDLRIYLSCDFNVDPMCWVLAHRFNGEYHFFDEICLENTNIVQTVEAFTNRYYGHTSGIIITGDASGKNRSVASERHNDTYYKILLNELSRLGFSQFSLDLKSANPLVETRVAAWNAMVCNSEGLRRVKIHPQCQWLIWNCENLKYIPGTSLIWEPTYKQIETHPRLKFTKHVWDAASYLVERYDPILLTQPQARSAKSQIVTRPFRMNGFLF